MRLAYFTIQRAESQGLFSILSRFFAGFAPFLPGKASVMDRSGEQGREKKNFQRFWKKGLTNGKESCIMQPALGRLAQLVEHALDVRRVSGSSPLSSTIRNSFPRRWRFQRLGRMSIFSGKRSKSVRSIAAGQPVAYHDGQSQFLQPCRASSFKGSRRAVLVRTCWTPTLCLTAGALSGRAKAMGMTCIM